MAPSSWKPAPEARALAGLGLYLGERFPPVAALALSVVLAGAALERGTIGSLPASAWVTVLLLFGARAYDDLEDLERDRLRRPDRVLPSGRAPASLLRRLALTAWVVAIASAAGMSAASGLLVLGACLLLLGFYAGRERLPPALGPLITGVVFAVPVLLGPIAAAAGLRRPALLALFAWLGSAAHDFAHGLEEAGIPDPLSPRAHARLGAGFYVASLAVAVAVERSRPDPFFGGAVAVGAMVVGPRLLALLRRPTAAGAAGLRVPAFLAFVIPLLGSLLWGLLR